MAGGSNPQNVQTPQQGGAQFTAMNFTPKPATIGLDGKPRSSAPPDQSMMGQMSQYGQQAQGGMNTTQAAQPAAPATTPAAGQPNIYQQSSNAYTQALQGTTAAGAYQPQNVQATQVGTQFGYTPQDVQAAQVGTQFGYTPQNVQAAQVGTQFGYTPQNVQAGTAAGGIGTYMNPYAQQVIDTSMADLERQRQMQQNQLGQQASAAGAFGGSRQGIAEAETNRAFAEKGGLLAAQLRQQGFNTALGASQQDVANQMQAALANQSAGANAAQFGQSTGLQAQGLNQSAGLQAALANQSAGANAAQFGQTTGLQAQGMNQSSGLQAALANQSAGANAAQFGQSTGLQAQGMNQSAGLQAALANQGAGFQAANLGLNAANQLGNLSQQGFNMGQSIGNQQWQQGLFQQGLNQNLINAIRGQYGGFTGSPAAGLGIYQSGLGGANMGQQTQTSTSNPGLFDYFTAGASLFCWVAREVYGPEDDRWMQFRAWMFGAAPDWLFNAYAKHGEAFAGIVRKVPVLKRALRPLMDRARRAAGFEV